MYIKVHALSSTPKEVLELLMSQMHADLIYYEYYEIKKDRGFGSIGFEKILGSSKDKRYIMLNMQNMKDEMCISIWVSPKEEIYVDEFEYNKKDPCIEEILDLLDPFIAKKLQVE